MTVLGECWDDTQKSRSVIKFVFLPTLTRLFLLVADASQCSCYTPDVADRSELIVAQSLFVCVGTIHVFGSRLRPRSEFVPSYVVLNTSVS